MGIRNSFRKGLLVLSVLCAASLPASAMPTAFDEANTAYQKGDFKAAAPLYEEVIRSNPGRPALYYNLGNTYFRMGLKGKAMLAYLRALRLAPRDADIRWNIQVLKTVLTDRVETPDRNLVQLGLMKMLDHVTMGEIGVSLTAALSLLWLLAFLSFLWPEGHLFTGFVRVAVIIGIGVTMLFFILKTQEEKDPAVVILQNEIYARYGPSYKETKAFLLHEGTDAKVIDETGDWIFVRVANHNTGWIPKNAAEFV